MTTEDQLLEASRTAQAAKELLESEAFNRILKEIEDQCLNNIKSSKPGEVDKRESEYHLIRAQQTLKTWLENMVSNEKLVRARHEQDKRNTRK